MEHVMEHVMLKADLMEVRGARSEMAASAYAQEKSGRVPDNIIHVMFGVYQVTLR